MIGAGGRGPAGLIAPGAGVTWADAGGAAPSLGGIYPVDQAGVDLSGGFILNVTMFYEAA